MCLATRWLMKGVFITFALYLSFPNRISLAEEDVWQKAISEGQQLRQQGRYAEAECDYNRAIELEGKQGE